MYFLGPKEKKSYRDKNAVAKAVENVDELELFW